jgi:SAM-dependent methyltransferase
MDGKDIEPVAKKSLPKEEINKLEPRRRIELRGYRSYVGGHNAERWYGIGKLQYHFLVKNGLRPAHRFLDVGCGSLRAGMYLIPYLDQGCYFGLEPEKLLVESGLKNEFFFEVWKERSPTFSYNYEFDLSFIGHFDYAMANSIFTHLNESDIKLCFANMRRKATAESVFYFTFFEGDSASNRYRDSHANRRWEYGFQEVVELSPGWNLTYHGDWGHPAG